MTRFHSQFDTRTRRRIGVSAAALLIGAIHTVSAQGIRAPSPFFPGPVAAPVYAPPAWQPPPGVVLGPAAPFPMGNWSAGFPPVVADPALSAPAIAPTPVSTAALLNEFAKDYEFVVLLGERFADRWVHTSRCDEGPYHDVILEAVVDGSQSTNSTTTLDIIRCDTGGRFLFVLDGVTKNRSLAKTPQAVIDTAGNYHFQITKQVEFDGRVVQTWTPAAFLTVQQRNLGAATPVSRIPLLGPIATNVALNAANQRRPLSEAIAAARVTESVVPEFNSRIDGELSKINSRLEEQVRGWLTSQRILPPRMGSRSGDDALLFGAAYSANAIEEPVVDLGGVRVLTPEDMPVQVAQAMPTLPPIIAPTPLENLTQRPVIAPPVSWDALPHADVALIAVHESLVKELGTRSLLAGWNISDLELNQLLNPDVVLPETNQLGLAKLLFSSTQPVSASFQNGELLLSFRITFQPNLGPNLPEQELTLAATPILEDAVVRFPFELREVRPVTGWENDLMRSMAEPVLKQAIAQQLRERSIPRDFDVPRDDGQPPVPLRIQSISTGDGWLNVVLEPRPAPQGE